MSFYKEFFLNLKDVQLKDVYHQCEIGRHCYGVPVIFDWGEGKALKMGSFCSFGSAVKIFLGGNHHSDWVSTFPFEHFFKDRLSEEMPGNPYSNGDVVIGNDVWVGSGVYIMSGVTIGNGAIIGAASVVTKDVMPYSIIAGNPAEYKKYRFHLETRNALQKMKWWDWDDEVIFERFLGGRFLNNIDGFIKEYRR